MHRFYMLHSFKVFHRSLAAAAALFLAAKVEEQPRKLEQVAKICYAYQNRDSPNLDSQSETYTKLVEDVTYHELLILETLGFEVAVEHPHKHVVRCTQMVRASRDLSQTAYFMAHNSLILTTFCLEHRPTAVACVCIHLACQWKGLEIPPADGKNWWECIDPNITLEQLNELTKEFLMIYEKCPSRLQRRVTEPMKMAMQQQTKGSRPDVGTSGHAPSSSRHLAVPTSESSRKGKNPTHSHPPGKQRPPSHPQQAKAHPPHPKAPPTVPPHQRPHEQSNPKHPHVQPMKPHHHSKPSRPPVPTGKSMPSGIVKPQAQGTNFKHDPSKHHHPQAAMAAKPHGHKAPSAGEQKYREYKVRQKGPEANHDSHRAHHRPALEDHRGTKRPHPLGDALDVKRTRYDPPLPPPLPSITPSLPPLPPLPSSPPPPPPPSHVHHQYSGLPPNVPLLPRGEDMRLPPLPPPLPRRDSSPPPPPPPPR